MSVYLVSPQTPEKKISLPRKWLTVDLIANLFDFHPATILCRDQLDETFVDVSQIVEGRTYDVIGGSITTVPAEDVKEEKDEPPNNQPSSVSKSSKKIPPGTLQADVIKVMNTSPSTSEELLQLLIRNGLQTPSGNNFTKKESNLRATLSVLARKKAIVRCGLHTYSLPANRDGMSDVDEKKTKRVETETHKKRGKSEITDHSENKKKKIRKIGKI
eukprot:TRINITY_DN9722_c0_g1_i2.p1 TRINITY_DN9722_c0_g1~~TRINITY_DN9722_c0_g1_i2.p1  ORF type:complete len:216 (-),score=52.04 TRINITY_DN9722_c0_g1_i2:58-705(-)